MANLYNVVINKADGTTPESLPVSTGAGAQRGPVRVAASPNAKYQIQDLSHPDKLGPQHIKVRRKGQDLLVTLSAGDAPDLIIENYYQTMPAGQNALIGQAENGKYYEYVSEDPNATGLVPLLADGGSAVSSALGVAEVPAGFAVAAAPLVAAAIGGGGLLAGLAVVGVAAAAAGKGGGGNAPVDTTAPSGQTGALAAASDTGLKNDNRTSNRTPSFTGQAEPGAKVEVTVNGKTYSTTAGTDGNYSVNITDPLPDGSHTPSIKVTDAAGNFSTVPGTAFTIDTTTQVAITDPGKGTTANAISGTGEAGSTITVRDAQNNTVGTATVGSDGRWSLTPSTAVPIGQLTASATDVAGNTASAQADNTGAAPAVPAITSVTDNAPGQLGAIQKYVTGVAGSLAQGVTNDNTPTIGGTGTPSSTVTLYDAGQAVGSATVAADGTWSITPTLSNDGVHTFTARATMAGVSSAATGDYPILLDTSKPTTPVVDPTGNSANTGTGTGNTYAVIDTVGARTGVVADQSIIDDATPTINGKGEVGATVTILDKGVALGTAVVGTDGKWSFRPATAFANASTHTITTTFTDAAGNTSSPSASTSFTIDTSNTPVQLTSVTDDVPGYTGTLTSGASTNDNTPTLTGTAAPGTTVTIRNNGSPIGTAQVDAQGNWSFTPTTALPQGANSLVVSGLDRANNPSSTSPFNLTVDTQAPAAPVIAAFGDDVGTVQNATTPTGQTTDDTTPTLKGTAEAGSTVTIRDASGAVVGTTIADSQGNWANTLAALPTNGNYAYKATATDAAGNSSSDSNTFSLTLDTVAPSGQTGRLAQVASSDSGAIGDNLTNVRSPAITGTAEPNAAVEVTVNGQRYTTTADANGNYSVTIPAANALPDGNYTPSIKVTDAAGNFSSVNGTPFTVDGTASNASITIGGIVDNVAPQPDGSTGNYTYPSSGSSTNDTSPLIQGTVATLATGETVHVYRDGADLGIATVNATTGAWTFQDGTGTAGTATAPLSNGTTYTYTAKVVDAASNAGTATANFLIAVDTSVPTAALALTGIVDSVAPQPNGSTGNYTYSSSGGSTNDTSPLIQGTVGTLATGETVHVYRDGADIGIATVNAATGAWTFQDGTGTAGTATAPLSSGATYTYTAKVVDAASNAGTATANFLITVNTSAPTAALTISGIVDNIAPQPDGSSGNYTYSSSGGSTNDTSPLIQGTVGTLAAGEAVHVYRDGLDIGIATVNATTGAWTFQDGTGAVGTATAPLSNSTTYTYTAKVVDAASNAGTATANFLIFVDTSTPTNAAVGLTIAISTDANNDSYVNSTELGTATTLTSRVSFNSTAVAGDKVILTASNDGTALPLTGISPHVLTAAEITQGYFDVTFTKPAEGKVQTVTATYADAAGNVATDAVKTDSATLDTTAPTNAAVGLGIAISTDANNDGYVNSTELGTATTLTSRVSFNSTAVAGDRVILTATNDGTALPLTGISPHVLTAAEITQGYFDVAFAKPAEGKVQAVTATYADAAGNTATDAVKTDSATLDTTAPTAALTLGSVVDNVAPQPDGSSGNYTYSSSGGSTNDTSPLIQGTVGTLAAGETVHLYRDGVDIGIATVNATTGAWTFQDGTGTAGTTTAPLSSGTTYTYTAKVVDAASNTGTATANFLITVDTSTLTLVADTASATEASSTSTGSTGTNFGANPRGNLLSNDTVGSSVSLSSVSGIGTAVQVRSGSTDLLNASDVTGSYGTLRVGADGSYTYFLNNDNAAINALQNGSTALTDRFQYTVKSATGASQSSSLTVSINGASDAQASTGTITGTANSYSSTGFVFHVGLTPDYDGDGKTDMVYDSRYGQATSAVVLSSRDYTAADLADGTLDGRVSTDNILKQANSFGIITRVEPSNGNSTSDTGITAMGDVDGDGLSDFFVTLHNPGNVYGPVANYFLSSKDIGRVLALSNHTITETNISTLSNSYSFATGDTWHGSPFAVNLSDANSGKEVVLVNTFSAWLLSPRNFEAMDTADSVNDNIVSDSANFNRTATGGTAYYYKIQSNTGNNNDRSVGNIGDAGDIDADGLNELMMYDPYSGQTGSDASFYLLNPKDLSALSTNSGVANTVNLRDINLGASSYEFRGAHIGNSNQQDMEKAGDINGDGKGDLLMTSLQDAKVWLVSGSDLEAIDTADGTNDNQISLSNVSRGASSYEFSSNFSWYASNSTNGGMHRAYGIGDIDGDGKSDLFLKNDLTGVGYIVLAKDLSAMDPDGDHKINIDTDWNKAGTSGYKITGLSTQFTYNFNATDSGFKLVSSGDLDGDGKSDFVVAEGDRGIIRTFLSSQLAAYDMTDGQSNHTFDATSAGTVLNAVNNDIRGSSGNDVLSGGSGDNVMYGNGGADVINAGAGNDRVVLNADNVAKLAQPGSYLDGGTGTDTLVLDGAGLSLNLSTIQSKIVGIEKIDLTGTGNNSLQLRLSDVLAISDNGQLYVGGNTGDSVTMTGQVAVTPTSTTVSGITYNDYNLNGTNHLYVQQGMQVIFV